MAITSLADYQAALKQVVWYQKNATGTQETHRCDFTNYAGSPAARTVVIANTTTGVVPTKSTTGYGALQFNDFSGDGYITRFEGYHNTHAYGRVMMYDMLFITGPFGNNAAVTLASQPSYASRVPGGTDFTGLKILAGYMTVTGLGHITSITVGYTNESGVSGRVTTGVLNYAYNNVGSQVLELALQSGDCGVQSIDSVTIPNNGTPMTVNIQVARPLLTYFGRLPAGTTNTPNYERMFHWGERTHMVQVFSDSAIHAILLDGSQENSTSPGLEFELEIASL